MCVYRLTYVVYVCMDYVYCMNICYMCIYSERETDIFQEDLGNSS